MSQVRGIVPLFVASYFLHAMLLVNSAETELANHQKPIGQLLSEQLAISAAPLIANQDSVGLGLLANNVGSTEAILGLKISNSQQQVLAAGGQGQSQQGQNFIAPIQLNNKVLGSVEITLSSAQRGEIIQHSVVNLVLSFVVHLFLALWIGWPQLFSNIRIPILQEPKAPTPEPEPIVPVVEPEPVKPAASVWVAIGFDDPKGLITKVNASTIDQFLQIIDKLVKRTTRLYSGKSLSNLTSDGLVIKFEGDNLADCSQRALLSSRLLIKLVNTAYGQRREAKQFALKVKASILNLAELNDNDADKQLKAVLNIAKVNQILLVDDETLLNDLKAKHQLLAFEVSEEASKAEKELKAHIVEALASAQEEELSGLEKRILERKKPNT
ncbi:MAG TPA: hypothetical protein PLW01_07755 [Agitococcus sp.]|nr:hypothetical protein [Agitococcus sp.]